VEKTAEQLAVASNIEKHLRYHRKTNAQVAASLAEIPEDEMLGLKLAVCMLASSQQRLLQQQMKLMLLNPALFAEITEEDEDDKRHELLRLHAAAQQAYAAMAPAKNGSSLAEVEEACEKLRRSLGVYLTLPPAADKT